MPATATKTPRERVIERPAGNMVAVVYLLYGFVLELR